MKHNCYKFFILTSAAHPGETPLRDTPQPGTLGVDGSLGATAFTDVDEGEMTLAKAVAASTRALVRVSCFGRLGRGAPTINGTCGGVFKSSWVPHVIIRAHSLYCGAE